MHSLGLQFALPTPDELKAEAKTLLNSSDEDIMQYIDDEV